MPIFKTFELILKNIYKKNKRIFLFLSGVGITLALAALLHSTFTSGYNYTFDNDELHHTQITFLLAKGYSPYKDIYLTVYPPLFHALLIPLYLVKGFSFSTMYDARTVMFFLSIIRLGLGTTIAYILFGTSAALFFIPLHLLNAFSVFTDMQIRPDNLMVTMYMLAITLSLISWKRNSVFLHGITGIITGLSALVLMKILPALVPFIVLSLILFAYKKRWKSASYFIGGVLFSMAMFCMTFLLLGVFQEMFLQTILESISSYSGVFEFPIPLGFFFHPRNPALYGLHGKPLNWYYAWILPILAFLGVYHVVLNAIRIKKIANWQNMHIFSLILAFLFSWGMLFFYESVFIQHYIPVNWLMALFASVAVTFFINEIKKIGKLHFFSLMLIILLLGALAETSIRANYRRAQETAAELIKWHQTMWSSIPQNEPVFPNQLFRPLAYPVPRGHFIGNIPDVIYNRLPNISASLEKNNTKYLYIDSYYISKLKPPIQQYIQSNYTKSSQNEYLYIKNDK